MPKLTYYEKACRKIMTEDEADKYMQEKGVIDENVVVVSAEEKREIMEYRKRLSQGRDN